MCVCVPLGVCIVSFSVCLSLFLIFLRPFIAGDFLVRPIFAFPTVWEGIHLFFARLRRYSFCILVDGGQNARGSGVLFALPVFLYV